MPIIALRAHYDGQQICLDEAYNLKPHTRLIVTVLPTTNTDIEHEGWLSMSRQKLGQAYGEDEPDYSESLIKQENSDYESS